MTKMPLTNSNSKHTNNNLQAAIKDMRAKSFYGFAILLQMLNNTAQLNLNDVTFFVPQDPQLSNISISVDRIEAFVLSHSIAMPLLFDDLVQFPTGSIVPSRYRNRMLRIHNHGRGNFVVNNALVNVPNVCSDYSKGIKCHGVNKRVGRRVSAESHSDIEREREPAEISFSFSSGEDKMNTDITASTKPEYPVVDRDPPFTKVVGNFDTLDYLRFVTITGVSVTVGYLSGIKPGIRGPSMVTGGLIGLMGGFMYAYQNSAGRLMGFFPNEGEVARYKK